MQGLPGEGNEGSRDWLPPSHAERVGWFSEPYAKSGGLSSGQGQALSRIPSPTPPAAFTSELCSNSGTGRGEGGTVLILFRLKTQLLISFKILAPNPKSKSRGWGNSARWKSSGCYFWSGWGWSSAFATRVSNPKCPRLGARSVCGSGP